MILLFHMTPINEIYYCLSLELDVGGSDLRYIDSFGLISFTRRYTEDVEL